MNKILNGLDRAKEKGFKTYRDFVVYCAGLNNKIWSGEINNKISANAYVDWGRWLVDCIGCNNTSYASPEEPFTFCSVCGNEFAEGKAVKVKFPSNREQIENELLLRQVQIKESNKEPTQALLTSKAVIFGLERGWNPKESIEDLKSQREKLEHKE